MQAREALEETLDTPFTLSLVRDERARDRSPALPIVGYREWRLATDHDGGPVLRSLTSDTAWPHHEPLRAVCHREHTWAWRRPSYRHEVPSPDCGCGIRASSHPFFERRPDADGDPRVAGVVLGLGRAEIDLEGWRAERARVWALVDPHHRGEVVHAAARYGARLLEHMPVAFEVTRAVVRER